MKFLIDSKSDEVLAKKVADLGDLRKKKEEQLLFLKKQCESIFESAEKERRVVWTDIVDRLKELNLVKADVKSLGDENYYYELNEHEQIFEKSQKEDKGSSISDLLGKLIK